MIRALFLALLLMLPACSAVTGLISSSLMGGGGPSLEVSPDIDNADGDINNTVETNVGSDTNNQSGEVINNINRMPPWQVALMCLLAGWAIPDPGKMFIGLATGTRRFFMILIRGKG